MKLMFLGAAHEVTGSCHYLEACGKHILVDYGMEQGKDIFENQELSVPAIDIDYVLLTHAHFDHMMAVNAVKAETGASVMVHAAEEPALTDERINLSSMVGTPYRTAADRLLQDGETIKVGNLTFTVVHTPGHTVGSCCYLMGDLLLSGDTLFADSIGRTDFPGGSMTVMQQSLAKLCTYPDPVGVLSGHGEATTLGREKLYNPFLQGR